MLGLESNASFDSNESPSESHKKRKRAGVELISSRSLSASRFFDLTSVSFGDAGVIHFYNQGLSHTVALSLCV